MEISRHLLYIYDCNHGINVYMVDRFILYIFISGFICQVLYVQIEHQDLPFTVRSYRYSYTTQLHFRKYISFIISGYSYYVNMLVTRLKSDMCLVFLLHN